MSDCRNDLFRRRSRGRPRAYVLIEILMTLALTAIVVSLATRVVMGILSAGHTLGEAERWETSLGRAVEGLRHDTELAAVVTSGDGAVTLGAVTWSVEPNALVRRENNDVDRFDNLPAMPIVAVDHGVVTLNVAKQAWAFAPLVDQRGDQ